MGSAKAKVTNTYETTHAVRIRLESTYTSRDASSINSLTELINDTTKITQVHLKTKCNILGDNSVKYVIRWIRSIFQSSTDTTQNTRVTKHQTKQTKLTTGQFSKSDLTIMVQVNI